MADVGYALDFIGRMVVEMRAELRDRRLRAGADGAIRALASRQG